MNETIQVTLDSNLLASLKQATEQAGASLEGALAELAQQYVSEQRSKKIRVEFEHYYALHTKLKKKYLGQHVAIHEGKLIDHDVAALKLARRVRRCLAMRLKQDHEIILGRDVLNKLLVFLDGPQRQTELLDDATVKRLRARRAKSSASKSKPAFRFLFAQIDD